MTDKEFLDAVTGGGGHIIALLLEILGGIHADFCVIGGLAVNAYVEPIVSLDLDVAVVADKIDQLCAAAKARGMTVEPFEHSVNLRGQGSDLRIQIQLDPRYQDFIPRAQAKTVLGYAMRVASLEDVLRGKVWACTDQTRRGSKRQKDLADIARLVEAYPALVTLVPPDVRQRAEFPGP
jgi:hypothetical protein